MVFIRFCNILGVRAPEGPAVKMTGRDRWRNLDGESANRQTNRPTSKQVGRQAGRQAGKNKQAKDEREQTRTNRNGQSRFAPL